MTDSSKPLCVDCDGTLIATDLLYEAFFLLIKQYPIGLLFLPFWLLKGKVFLKERLADHVDFNWANLPYREDVLSLIKSAHLENREVVLATASPLAWATGIANHLGCFDKVIATQNGVNLSGENKAAHLISLFGDKNFDYVGDSSVDLKVWTHSAGVIIVSSNQSLINSAAKSNSNVLQVIAKPKADFLVYVKALRVHQWLKNLLIAVPLLAAHQANSSQGLLYVIYAFLSFSMCASSVYVLNDLLDLDSDRQHIRKRKRPFAACTIPLWQGILMVPMLLVISFAISLLLPYQFFFRTLHLFCFNTCIFDTTKKASYCGCNASRRLIYHENHCWSSSNKYHTVFFGYWHFLCFYFLVWP